MTTDKEADVAEVAVVLSDDGLFNVGAEFEINDPHEEGTLFRVLEYKPMGDKARALWGVEDATAVYATELERHDQHLVGTRFRAFPVSLMVAPGTRRSNRSAGVSKSTREPRNPKQCKCGCGEMTKGGEFKPGHDARFHARQKVES